MSTVRNHEEEIKIYKVRKLGALEETGERGITRACYRTRRTRAE